MCGVLGIYSNKDVTKELYYSLYSMQHRGQESCGLALLDDGEIKYKKDMGLVGDVFKENELSKLKGNIGIGHVRYSTTGSTKVENAQPLLASSKLGPIAMAHNGNLVNADVIRDLLEDGGHVFHTTIDSEVIATLIARVLETTILIAYIYISKSVLAGNMKELFSFSRDFVKMIFITMIPVLLNEGCWGLGSVMYNVIYGRIGTQAIASVQIATTVYNLFMVVIFGIGSASLVIVGNEIGRGDKDKGYKYGKKCVMLGCIVGIILSLGLILLSNQIVTLYDVSEQVRIWARNILYVIAFIMVIRVYNIIIIVGVLRGGGDAKVSLAIEASTMWLIGVPVAFMGAFILKLPVYQVYALCTLEEIVKGVFCLRRFKSKKWINNLVEQ